MELKNFPCGSYDLASNTLAKYLTDTERCHPFIIFMQGNADFQEAENSTVHGHVIVLLDGEYIDLTLDQFPEYPGYIQAESVESGGPQGKLLRNIIKYEDPVNIRRVALNGGEALSAWLSEAAESVLAADPEWQPRKQSIAEHREEALKLFSFLGASSQTGTNVTGDEN